MASFRAFLDGPQVECQPFLTMIRLMICCLLCASAVMVRASVPLGEAWCGTDGGELPDLWMQTIVELEALEEIPKAEAWRR